MQLCKWTMSFFAVLTLCAEPSWADIALQAQMSQPLYRPSTFSDNIWPFIGILPSLAFLGFLTWCLYNIFPPLGHIGLAITLLFAAWPIAHVGNFTGDNPREVSIFTAHNGFYISKHEYERVNRLTWKFQEECYRQGSSSCIDSLWKAHHDCVGRNNCRGKLVEVYNERRRELAANPHAFSSFKPCNDWRIDKWAKCW